MVFPRSLVLGLALSACTVSVGSSDDDPSGAGESAQDSTGADASSDGSTGGTSETGQPPKLDVAHGTDTGLPDPSGEGCEKIDFVFVIDNSDSMMQEQLALIQSFPGFISTIEDTVADNFHIMVVDTDTARDEQFSSDSCFPDHFPACCDQMCTMSPTCHGIACSELDSCDHALGAGKTADKTGAACGVAGGERYMAGGQQDLTDTFACVAEVGVFGSTLERPMEALTEAVGSDLNGAGGCNDGFVRDDAILVVTFITDEPDNHSFGDPDVWKQALVDAKGGNEDAVVVLGLLNDSDLPNAVCGNQTGAIEMRLFTYGFEYGMWASVCEPDFTPFFADAVQTIDAACDAFEPEG